MATNRYLEKFKDRVEAKGGVVLEDEWLGNQTPHHVRCAAGHDCWPMPNNIQQGRGICSKCLHANRVDPKSAPAEAAFTARLAEPGAGNCWSPSGSARSHGIASAAPRAIPVTRCLTALSTEAASAVSAVSPTA